VRSPFLTISACRFCKIGQGSREISLLAQYYSERMLQEYRMVKYKPSLIGACSLALARKTVGKTTWVSFRNRPISAHSKFVLWQKPDLAQYSNYTERDLHACLTDMIDLLHPGHGSGRKSTITAVVKKWSSERCQQIALKYYIPTSLLWIRRPSDSRPPLASCSHLPS
jgi:hypothetical protein